MISTRTILGKLLPAVAIVATLTGSASAQSPLAPKFSLGEDKPKLTPEEQEKQDAIDQAYKSATKKIPDQKQAADPWATVRPQSSAAAPSPAPRKKPQ
ncbi:MAG: hypothetical protein ABSE22_24155 [Xanthobacteraceae bacterium]|jgi:hypothetical protein